VKRRILFVDDEPRVLEGLRNQLRKQRRKWDMRFAEGGEEALKLLSEQPADVVVTDMRMPLMDGAELLAQVQVKYAKAVRIVLSGHSELEAALRAVPVAHQFLSKPCGAEELESVISRACNLQALINDEAVQSAIGNIERLPAAPQIYAELNRELASPQATAQSVTRILQQDVGMSAKLLQLVNSAFFSSRWATSDVETAVARLGFQTIRNLVMALDVFGGSLRVEGKDFTVDGLQQHAMETARIARELVSGKQLREDAFAAGMLHDIGKLVMAANLPDHLQQASALATKERVPLYVAEEQLYGITHAELGAYLLGIWGLPYSVVEAVGNHHHPSRVGSTQFDVVGAVHVANALAANTQDAGELGADSLDGAYIDNLGLAAQIDDWRERFHQSGAPTVP